MIDTPKIPIKEAAETLLSTEVINAKLKGLGIDPGELRPAALPEYGGMGDEHILAGGVSAGEALALYASPDWAARGIMVGGVSAAEIYPGKRKIWLPDLTNREEARKHFRNEAARLTRELKFTKGQLELAEADVARLVDRNNLLTLGLRFALFDWFEGRESGWRYLFRRHHLDLPDMKTTEEAVDDLIVTTGVEMSEWVIAKGGFEPKPPLTKTRAKKIARKIAAKKASATKRRRKKPARMRGM